jgi:hypothetical protein
MTLYRTRTTNERVRIIENARNTLARAAAGCREAQRYHDECSDFANRADNVNARMANVAADLAAVIAELTDLATAGNMAFRYEWTVGRQGVASFLLDATADTIVLLDAVDAEEGVAMQAFTGAVIVADVVLLSGSASNDERFVVSNVSGTALTLTAAAVNADEEVTNGGAKLALLLKEIP